MGNLLDLISRLFGTKKPPPAPVRPVAPPDSPNEPAQLTLSRVLVLVYDPVMDSATGRKLSETQGWYRVEDLATGFMSDILKCSGGLARYQIVQRIDIAEFPPKTDGFRYTPETYMNVLRGVTPPRMPQEADYGAILTRFKVLERVARNEIDEVWIIAFPHAGLYESTMGGPGAFWCNAPPLKNTAASQRRFVVMGFSYERNVGEMLHSFGHRAESIVMRAFEKLSGEANLWQRFTRYDLVAPGKAAVGTVHFAPNSTRDYEWDNARTVTSECYDWLNNFPNFKGDRRPVNTAEWGNGEPRAYQQWWLKHLPKVAGRKNGVHNNWWQYIMNPNNIVV
ncbi:MAG TPA: hypothetical protein VGJ22_05570 [Anaerolineales bacterium]|jgi:hypothetical protein